MFYPLFLMLAAGLACWEFTPRYAVKSIPRVLPQQNKIIKIPTSESEKIYSYRVKRGVVIIIPDWIVLLLLIIILSTFLFWIVGKNIELESQRKVELRAKQNRENNLNYLNSNQTGLLSNNNNLDDRPINSELPPLPKSDTVAQLIEDLDRSEASKRPKIIWELARRADSRAIKPLLELAIEAGSRERSLILTAISNIATRALKASDRALKISLEDRNPRLPKNAIGEVTTVEEFMSEITQRLSYLSDDDDLEVRKTVAWALKQLNKVQSYKNLPRNQSDNNRMSIIKEFDV